MVYNINDISDSFISKYAGGAITKRLGKAASSEDIYINIDEINSGQKSAKYHSHTNQEEFFLVLSGKGVLRYKGVEYEVSEGDFFAKPAGLENPHQFTNTGTKTMKILDIGTKVTGDICYYPDEKIYNLRDQGRIFSEESNLSDWSTEPNED